MSATNKLDKIAARANAATEGPWLWIISEDRRWAEVIVSMPDAITVSRSADDDDADFIAHARTDVPALVAALRAVLEEIEKRKHTVGDRLTLADVLPRRIEEALS